MPAEHLTPNMVAALRALDNLVGTVEYPKPGHDGSLTNPEIGQHLDIRFSKGSYMGQPKTFGRGSAAAAICRALLRRGLVRETWTERYGETVPGWQITAAGCAKLSEVSETMPA